MISANFIHNTLTKPVEARAMPPKERREIIRHKDGAVTPESLKSLEPEFRLVREYVKERRPHISRSAGKGIFSAALRSQSGRLWIFSAALSLPPASRSR